MCENLYIICINNIKIYLSIKSIKINSFCIFDNRKGNKIW